MKKRNFDAGYMFSNGIKMITEGTHIDSDHKDKELFYGMVDKFLTLDQNDAEEIYTKYIPYLQKTVCRLYKVNPDAFDEFYLNDNPDYVLRVFDPEYEGGELFMFISSIAVIDYVNDRPFSYPPEYMDVIYTREDG